MQSFDTLSDTVGHRAWLTICRADVEMNERADGRRRLVADMEEADIVGDGRIAETLQLQSRLSDIWIGKFLQESTFRLDDDAVASSFL